MKWFPTVASEWALQWEYHNLYLHFWIAFFTVVIFLGVFWFAVKYRRRSEDEQPRPILGSNIAEIVWTLVPLLIAMSMFAWGAALYFEYASPPENAIEVYITGKQWMWYAQHPEGQREINELHVPVGRPIKLTMTSEDVIHSFFVPVFRLKRDVIPGRYTTIWFTATKAGRYHLFCAEYCGAQHSRMGGWVYVMEPAAYEEWLSGGAAGSMAAQGEKLFAQFGCASCHLSGQQGRCPNLTNVFGNRVELSGGATVVADATYIRESILNPAAKVVAGFQNIMPSFQGQVSEQNLLQLIAFIRSLSSAGSLGVPAGEAGGIGQRPPATPARVDRRTQGRPRQP
ncbi:MAG: cytochrome c oxidase subunit II [Acidobacteria bacterium]|nr:cytochrome c oxidase subunit II [Acidobacteriota bacterium]MBI3280064.1 cytochrome c oxidase subunit II [Acidobacteriota bacterium]